MAFDDLPSEPAISRPIIVYETRNILDGNDHIIGTLTLPNTTTESAWASFLSNFDIPGLPFSLPNIINTLTANSSSPVTTSSGTPSIIGSMSIKPVAGTYLAFFSGNIKTDGASAKGEFGIYVNNVLLPETRRDISCALTLLGGLVTVSLNTIGVGTYTGTQIDLDGTQTLSAQFKSNNNGTIGFNERTLMLLRIKNG